jgi:hypothetical protein
MTPEEIKAIFDRYMPYSERGETLLSGDAGSIAFFGTIVPDQLFIEFIYHPENYPSVDLDVFKSTDEELRRHIQSHFTGWNLDKNNLEVPSAEDGTVLEL